MLPRPILGLYFLARAGEFRVTQPAPSGLPVVKVPGRNPLRVLVAGAGIAYGYGASSYDTALAGPLAHGLAERLRRGVVVETRAVPVLPMRRAVGLLGLNGAHTFDAVVFSPCYLEARSAPGHGLRRYLPEVIEHLRSTGSERVEIVLTGFPRPLADTGIDSATGTVVDGVNRIIAGIARDDGRVRYVEPSGFPTMRSRQPFGPDLYSVTADRIAAVLTTRFAPAPHPR